MAWEQDLQSADSSDEVLEVVNDFVARQGERYWTRIPAASRPAMVSRAEDVQAWHHRLVQELRRHKPATIELQELCVLFLRAAVRLHQIELQELDRHGAPNDDLKCAPARVPPRHGR